MVRTLHVNGSRGEITPLMHSRVDTEFYQAAFARAENVVVSRYGPLMRVPGTVFDGRAKTAGSPTRMLPFEFNDEQIYAIEAGVGYLRFWTPEGLVVSGGSPYEVATTYVADDLSLLHGRQIGDALYLFAGGKRVKVLKRLGETNWTLGDFNPEDGPYLDLNNTSTTLQPGSTGAIHPRMTSDTTPSGEVTVNQGSDPWHVFDQDSSTVFSTNDVVGTITFTPDTSKVCDAYWVKSSAIEDPSYAPASWSFQGYDGSAWVTLDSRDKESGWGRGERRYYEFSNKSAFEAYRFRWLGTSAPEDKPNTRIAEMGWHEAAETQTSISLTASSTTGINDGAGFRADDVGRAIRFMGSDSRWRWMKIVAYVNTTQVRVQIYGHALPDTTRSLNWQLGAWSEYTGWPFTGRLYEDRFVLAGSKNDPIAVWMSISAGYNSFRTSTPPVDDDGITVRLTGGKLNPIRWLAEAGVLLAGTGGSLRSVGSREGGAALSPTNIRQRSETATAASAIQPTEVETVILFVDRLKKRLYEAAYDYNSDAYLAREVSTLNEHLFRVGIEQIAFLDAPHKFCLARRSDGKVVFFAYDREQKIVGGTLCDFQGFVRDIMVMSGRENPDVWMVVDRTVNGSTVTTIERLADFYRVGDSKPPIYGACSTYYSFGSPVSQVTGLTALNGFTFAVMADGHEIGQATVSAGVLTLPGGRTAQQIVLGLTMPWRVESLRLPTYGQPDGAGLGRKMRIANEHIDLFEAAGVYAGTQREQMLVRDENYVEHDPSDPPPLLTGMFPLYADDSFRDEGVFVIWGNSLYPATIRGVSLEVEGEP